MWQALLLLVKTGPCNVLHTYCVQANKRTLGEILAADIRLVAPLFQRPYVWSEVENWEPLWRAVEDAAGNRLKGTTARPYFMGAIVLAKLDGLTGSVSSREIIDGQQRMTTLQILMESAKSLAADSDSISRLLDRVTRNILGTGTDFQYKVWPTNVDRDTFRDVMEGRSKNGRMHDARQYFTERLSSWIGHGNDRLERLTAIVNGLINDLVFIAIDLDNDDDGQLIFETLNSLGAPLLPSDLVKNLLFRAAQAESLNTDDLYSRYWRQFEVEDGYWRSTVEVGRRKRSRLDLFLQHYLVLHVGRETQTSHQFRDFRDHYLKGKFGTVVEALADFARLASIYQKFDVASSSDQVGQLRLFLRVTDLNLPFPLILGILAKASNPNVEIEMLATVESYLVRRILGGSGGKNLSRIVPDTISKLNEIGWTNENLRGVLLEGKGNSSVWFDDGHIQWRICNRSAYYDIRTATLGYLFSRVENHLRNAKAEEPFKIGAPVQIEHIMPQKWADHWPLGQGDQGELTGQRNEAIHRFGNLTILTGPLNLSVSNAGWIEKRKKLGDESVLKLNRRVALNEKWSESTILERSKELADIFCILWPR